MNNSTAFKLAQLPATCLRVGIDPHKRQHAIVTRTPQAQVLSKFKIANDRDGFEELVRRCEQFRQQCGAEGLVFAIEAGSHYWRNLGYFLKEHGQTFRLINPYTLKRERDGNDLGRRKNDYRDAEQAADLLGQGKYTWTALPEGSYAELRDAHETYQQLVRQTTRVKLELSTALDGLFPEFPQVFKSLEGFTALTVLRTNPQPAVITILTEAEFVEQVRTQHGAHRFMAAKVRALHALAARSAGVSAGTEALTQRVQLLADRLAFLVAQRQQAEATLTQRFQQFEESTFLLSLPGLGAVNGAGLLAHIGPIGRYSGVKQLTKLAGIHPQENSSADRSAQRTPMSKKGRAGLREVAYRSVIGLLRHNPVFAKYVKRLTKRSIARHPLTKREAIGAAMNKLLRIVYALLHKRTHFDPKQAIAARAG
jgi:transposase